MKKYIYIIVFLLAFTTFVSGQATYKYWIQFTDKNNTPYSLESPNDYLSARAIERRTKQNIGIDSTDLPVNQIYVNTILQYGGSLHTRSKWLNGITISIQDTSSIGAIRTLPFVKKVELTFEPSASKRKTKIGKVRQTKNTTDDPIYGSAYPQIEIHKGHLLHQEGYNGQGIYIALLDAGYENVNTTTVFENMRTQNRLLGTKDFVDATSDIYKQSGHGATVLSVMAGNQSGRFIGTAPLASYWLIRTEDVSSEFPVEVDNMVAGMEFADSVGVDIITASLGYFQFDNIRMNYAVSQLDGKTVRASIAAENAAKKGILMICSAGNEGNKDWQKITFPADAEDILTVGAINSEKERVAFSSVGPSSDGRIKPTVCAIGESTAVIRPDDVIGVSSGTSFSAPIIAGLSACLWQALPNYSNREIIDLIIRNSDNYTHPDNYIGYGIPNFYGAYLEGIGAVKTSLVTGKKRWANICPNPTKDELKVELTSLSKDTCILYIFDTKGMKVHEQVLLDTLTLIDTTKLKKGAYTVVIRKGKISLKETLLKN